MKRPQSPQLTSLVWAAMGSRPTHPSVTWWLTTPRRVDSTVQLRAKIQIRSRPCSSSLMDVPPYTSIRGIRPSSQSAWWCSGSVISAVSNFKLSTLKNWRPRRTRRKTSWRRTKKLNTFSWIKPGISLTCKRTVWNTSLTSRGRLTVITKLKTYCSLSWAGKCLTSTRLSSRFKCGKTLPESVLELERQATALSQLTRWISAVLLKDHRRLLALIRARDLRVMPT